MGTSSSFSFLCSNFNVMCSLIIFFARARVCVCKQRTTITFMSSAASGSSWAALCPLWSRRGPYSRRASPPTSRSSCSTHCRSCLCVFVYFSDSYVSMLTASLVLFVCMRQKYMTMVDGHMNGGRPASDIQFLHDCSKRDFINMLRANSSSAVRYLPSFLSSFLLRCRCFSALSRYRLMSVHVLRSRGALSQMYKRMQKHLAHREPASDRLVIAPGTIRSLVYAYGLTHARTHRRTCSSCSITRSTWRVSATSCPLSTRCRPRATCSRCSRRYGHCHSIVYCKYINPITFHAPESSSPN